MVWKKGQSGSCNAGNRKPYILTAVVSLNSDQAMNVSGPPSLGVESGGRDVPSLQENKRPK